MSARLAVPAPPPDIARPLLRWYDRHRRPLPWREPGNQTPYRIWLAEIMLQQTTVATVIPYYQRFLDRWPTVDALASAPMEDVLAAWAGLGYYHRARNLHACAQTVVARGGLFPDTEAGLRLLPGIGPYTAASVAAIAFDSPANVVDGNVERVMARLFASPGNKTALKALAAPLVPLKRAGDYAQALMDLGATICTPRAPACPTCPLRTHCQAANTGDPARYPQRPEKKTPPRRQAVIAVLFSPEGDVWLRRRPAKGLLGGMLEFPSSPWTHEKPPARRTITSALFPDVPPAAWRAPAEAQVRHTFTHFALTLQVAVATAPLASAPDGGLWLSPDAATRNALPTVMRKVLHTALRARVNT